MTYKVIMYVRYNIVIIAIELVELVGLVGLFKIVEILDWVERVGLGRMMMNYVELGLVGLNWDEFS